MIEGFVLPPRYREGESPMDDDLQLDLFTWDRVKTGEGFRALAALDFEKAKGIFDEVLARWPGHPDASAGFRMAADWSAILTRADALHGEEAIAALCAPGTHWITGNVIGVDGGEDLTG